MSIFKKLFGSSSNGDGGDPPDFSAYLEASMEGLRMQSSAHQGTWGFGREEQWGFDQDTGHLTFIFPDKIARAAAQIIGTFDGTSDTWLWSWANRSISEPLKVDALRVREYGKQHGIRRLTESKWAAKEIDGWRMAAVSNRLCEANGAYRGLSGTTLVFMTFGEIELVKKA